MLSTSLGMPSRKKRAAKYLGHAWYIGKRFCKSNGVFFSTLSARVQSLGLQCIRTHITHVMSESQTPAQDQRCQSAQSAEISSTLVREDFSKNYGADQQRLQISDPHFDKSPTPATFACWKIRFKTGGMYVFTISYGNFAVDQRSGDG